MKQCRLHLNAFPAGVDSSTLVSPICTPLYSSYTKILIVCNHHRYKYSTRKTFKRFSRIFSLTCKSFFSPNCRFFVRVVSLPCLNPASATMQYLFLKAQFQQIDLSPQSLGILITDRSTTIHLITIARTIRICTQKKHWLMSHTCWYFFVNGFIAFTTLRGDWRARELRKVRRISQVFAVFLSQTKMTVELLSLKF